jgi:uncharacterized membrane protein
MAEQHAAINALEKKIGWTSSIGVTMPVSNAEIYQRVEKVKPALLDNGILWVQITIKLMAVITSAYNDEQVLKPAKVFTNHAEIISFVYLYEGIKREDITSIDNQVEIEDYFFRPDKIIINGNLNLKIKYLVNLVLEGLVTAFPGGAPLKGATVNVRNTETNDIIATTTTGGNGRYFLKNLKPGIYLIEAHSKTHRSDQKISVVKTRDTVNFSLHH